MRSRTVHLPAGACTREILLAGLPSAAEPAPDLALGFLPAHELKEASLAALASAWPASLIFGCESADPFADAGSAADGSVQLLWFDDCRQRAAVEVIAGSREAPPALTAVEELAGRLETADGVLLLAYGPAFPIEDLLAALRWRLGAGVPLLAAGLSTPAAPPARTSRPGARVFCRRDIYASACLALAFHGAALQAEVARELDNALLRNLLAQTTRAYEKKRLALAAEKELAQVTLASIGDGVLATDRQARVEYLNPVAETLTGWSRAEAQGRPFAAILRLVDDETDGPVPSLVERCLASGESLRIAERITLERRDGRRYALECSCAPIRGGDGAVIGTVIVFQDVSDSRLMALQLAHQATHDELTGLFNRQAFDHHLQRALEESRQFASTHALCYMDLDQFKVVNDTCGHLAGDELLRKVTALLQESLRDEDLVARLGGDEFGVLLPRCTLPGAKRRVQAFHRALQAFRYTWRDKTFAIGASVGLVPITRQWKSVAHLLSAADHACYVAKERGRNRIQVYQEDDVEIVRRQDEMNWVVRIQRTLEQDRFRLFSQQIRPLSPRASKGLYFEVLLRMVEDDGRIHLPSDFLRAAERYGLMRSIDRWVVGHCLETLSAQPESFMQALSTCAINLSAMSLGDDSFLDFVAEQFARFPVPPGKICFEITETAAIENLSHAERLLATLSRMGIRFALDDFGTGMSSYAYLKAIPVSLLKIDGKFIRDMVTDPHDRAMVESINQVGHVMGLETVAEAVGSGAVAERLRSLGVDYAQGNWVSPPVPLSGVCAAAARV